MTDRNATIVDRACWDQLSFVYSPEGQLLVDVLVDEGEALVVELERWTARAWLIRRVLFSGLPDEIVWAVTSGTETGRFARFAELCSKVAGNGEVLTAGRPNTAVPSWWAEREGDQASTNR